MKLQQICPKILLTIPLHQYNYQERERESWSYSSIYIYMMNMMRYIAGRNNRNEYDGGGEIIKSEKMEDERFRERKSRMEKPPNDDVCPICFGDFVFPCRADCGHWYCGSCILLYWNYASAIRPCKCPMCSQRITRLIPEVSFNSSANVDVLENVKKYNLLFVGGMYGFFRKVVRLPFLIKRSIGEMMEPNGNPNGYHILRFFVILLGAIYCSGRYEFLPKAMNSVSAFDLALTMLVLILQIVGCFCRWLRRRRARRLQLV